MVKNVIEDLKYGFLLRGRKYQKQYFKKNTLLFKTISLVCYIFRKSNYGSASWLTFTHTGHLLSTR